MSTETWNPWGDGPIADDELDSYIKWSNNLHDFEPDPEDEFNRCKATVYWAGQERKCNMNSHSTTHLPMACCHCKHGVYLHTSYDIPCGRCEMGDYEDADY